MAITPGHIKQRLSALGFNPDVADRYGEPHRFYHTMQHLLDVVNYMHNVYHDDSGQELPNDLFLAAVYHDAIYDPKATDNEEKSAALFAADAAAAGLPAEDIKTVRQLILDTKKHEASSERSELLISADLDILNGPFERLMAYEQQIFKEYQFVDYRTYLPKRLEVINSLFMDDPERKEAFIDYVKNRKPLIGVFAGSFNPFHKGHFNVLQKAERIFDKVIIAFGKNPDKNERTWEIPGSIQNRQIEEYSGLLTDFIESLGQDVVVVRGLRNSTDFQYEQNQYRYIQELMPGINIINIFCDKEFEHISSSGIRTLEKFGKHEGYLLH